MRLVIHQDFPFTDMSFEDLETLKSFCVNTKATEAGTFSDQVFYNGFILGQKIDLKPDNLATVLDIIDFHTNGVVSLVRYERERYTLKID